MHGVRPGAKSAYNSAFWGHPMNRSVLGYSLILAAGLIITTLVAANLPKSAGYAMIGPLLMSVTMIGVGTVGERKTTGMLRLALFLCGAMILASAIIAFKDPANVAAMLPILSAALMAPLLIKLSGDNNRNDPPGSRN